MSKILGIWGEVPEENQEWHQKMQIPEATKRLGTRAFHFQAGKNMFPEDHAQTATSFTLYDPLESTESQSSIEQSLPLSGLSSDALKDVLLEARSYTSHLEDKAKEFSGDYADIGCLVMGVFQPTPATHDAFFEWWRGEFIPFIQRSPDFLRVRLWKLDEAADLRERTVQMRDRNNLLAYVMVYEFQSDDMPWEVAVEIGQSKAYQQLVEQDLQYKYGVYHLKRIYGETGEVEAEFNNDVYSDEEDDSE
ncbi:uncharacterized protein N0V89_007255 [Didymosphaeria variabile]|uniref:Uncharacterized protein n=1 Tax=Didymosphaeria variabile TaxID=1932322 RepID=A0A9W9CAM8_9PLEO|nr:uncharacterized protein N0V89_007255 [Didymosphaeria variabile]KAJ4351911.1 hypothetical protein N0V89_007255 [Didymosphaeria variabile]